MTLSERPILRFTSQSSFQRQLTSKLTCDEILLPPKLKEEPPPARQKTLAAPTAHQLALAGDRGFGDLKTTLVDGDTVSSITANVSSAYLNRSVVNGVVGEHLSLEATGLLNVSEETEDASLNIDGELAVFLFEYVDVDGERVLQNTQFEAMADLVQIDDGARLDISLDGFSSHERWVDGVRVVHLDELYGGGTIGYTEQDENATALVNGTIYDFHQKLEQDKRCLSGDLPNMMMMMLRLELAPETNQRNSMTLGLR